MNSDLTVSPETSQRTVPDATALAASFVQRFGKKPRLFQAPGRVNLIGEHTDYNEGFVMPAAIEFNTLVAADIRSDRKLVVHSLQFEETLEFNLDEAPTPAHDWSDYIRGVVLELQRSGLDIGGVNLLVTGDVPFGSGLSSSASVEIAVAFALTSLCSSAEPDRAHLATLCQRAENEFVGARCGIMDQFISAHGKRDHALMLDCRSLAFELLPIPASTSIVICNTMVKHQIAAGEYNTRRQECEQGVARLQHRLPHISALRDVTTQELEANKELLDPLTYRRCRHVISENERVLNAAAALRESSLTRFGQLMYESHNSLHDDYEVSCPELDTMVSIASGAPGVIGARMTGGGFGGCTVNLVQSSAVDQFRSTVAKGYKSQAGIEPSIYVTKASEGASELSLSVDHHPARKDQY